MNGAKIKFIANAAFEYCGMRGFLPGTRGAPKPVKVYFEMCTACNFRCNHCNCHSLRTQESSTSYWLKALSDLHAWAPGFALGFGYAEPLLTPGVFDVIKEASALVVPTLFTSNGSLLDAAAARRIAESGLKNLYLSMDGLSPATHDALRAPGSYAGLMSAISNLKALGRGPRIYAATIFSAANLGEAVPLVHWAAENGLDGITFQPIEKRTSGCDPLWPSAPAAVARTVDGLLRLKRKGFPIRNSARHLALFNDYFHGGEPGPVTGECFASRTLRLKANGDVYCCPFRPPLGNINKSRIADIWSSESAALARLEISRCRRAGCYLLNCNFGPSLSAIFWDLAAYLKR
jgi:MoaA/NifB/PqqE/SkfB family radical SAM enzyme